MSDNKPSTVVTEGNLSWLDQNKKSQYRSMEMHDEQLRQALIEACENAHIPDGIRNEIVENGIWRFTISSDGVVKPQSSYPDLKSYVTAHREKHPNAKRTAEQLADINKVKKMEAYDLMLHYAEIGDHVNFRKQRNRWASL